MSREPGSQPATVVRNERRFRPDIEGLRAIAIALVVAFHADVRSISGGFVGVDVFFVISGFLITGLLDAEHRRTGRVSLSAFYTRRMRRLLPASVLVLIVTAIASRAFLPPLVFRRSGHDILAAALYVSNILFAFRGTQYFFALARPSVVQHYWSLGVEEQFYLVWPVLFLAAARRTISRRRAVAVIAGLGIASLFASVLLTHVAQPLAFFLLPSRAWELATGSLLALSIQRFEQVDQRVATTLGWLGLAAIAISGLIFDQFTSFPGVNALLPVAGTAAVIVGCTSNPRFGPQMLLGRGPLLAIGRWSYSIYLWHWPIFILAADARGHTVSGRGKIALAVATVALGGVTYHVVEQPFRTSRLFVSSRRRTYALAAVLTAAAVSAALVIPPPAIPREVAADIEAANSPTLGVPNGCLIEILETVPKNCMFGDKSASRTMALFGDSHAAQWFLPLNTIARRNRWRLAVFVKAACPAVTVTTHYSRLMRAYRECDSWRLGALRRISELGVSAVVLSSARGYILEHSTGSYEDAWAAGLRSTLSALPPKARAVVLGDTPRQKVDVSACLSARHLEPGACETRRSVAVATSHLAAEQRAAKDSDAAFIDPSDWLCNADPCPVVRNGLLVYRNFDHISIPFAQSLVPQLEAALRSAGVLKTK